MGDIKATGMSQKDMYTFMSNVVSQVNTLQTNVTALETRLNDVLKLMDNSTSTTLNSVSTLNVSASTNLNAAFSSSASTSGWSSFAASLSSMSSISLTSL
jgi:hypothetical protein